MKLISVKLPDDHNIFLYGDVHEGSVLSCKAAWDKFVNMLFSEYAGCKNNYASDGGDAIEGILADDPRYNEQTEKEAKPLRQKKIATEKRREFKHLLLQMLTGNHERKLWKFGPITQEMCEDLGVPFGTYSCKLSVNNKKGKLMYKIYQTHGSRSISSTADDPIRMAANMRLILKRQLKFKFADCAVMIKHHAHKLIASKPETQLYLTDDGTQVSQNYTYWGQNESYIHPDARWYGCAGSFLKLFGDNVSGYAEIAEYDPVELGFLVLRVRDRKIVGLDPVFLDL